MAKAPDYLVFGHLLVEDTVMPGGERALGRLGGDAVYATVGAHIWTDRVASVGRVGHNFPREHIAALERAGYETAGLVPCEHNTLRLWVHYDERGGREYTFRDDSGTYAELTVSPQEVPAQLARDLVGCHVAPVPFEQQEALVRWARDRARCVTVDPHYEWMRGHAEAWRRLLPLVDVFLPSREEAEDLLGHWRGAEAAARALADWGASVVCLKLGSDGAFVHERASGRAWRVPPVKTEPTDVTGCGDAFCGGFVVGFCETGDPYTAACYGAVSSSFVAADFGAAHALVVDRAEARRRLDAALVASATLR